MHHLTPNGIVKIALFIWAIKSPNGIAKIAKIALQDVNLDIRAFCALHEMHTRFSSKNVNGKTVIKYFGCYSFKPARGAKQISSASKNKWVENLYRY